MRINLDSRTIQPGETFIPIKGPNFDGRNFIQDVIKKGGHVLDVDLVAYAKKYRKKLSCSVIGVTGSAGKTTLKDMLYYVLSQKFSVVRTRENENNEIGVPLTVLRADADTDILIVEMGIRKPGDMKPLSQIVRPTHVVITGIGVTHLEFFKNQKQLAQTKADIFQKPLGWETQTRQAYLNFSAPYYDVQKKKAERSDYVVYPFKGQDKIDQSINAVYQVARSFGLTDDQIRQGIDAYQPSSHRLTVFKQNGFLLVDDSYNANPDGVAYALSYLRQFSGRKILVLGDMLELGEASEAAHNAIPDQAIDAGVSCLLTLGAETAKIISPDLINSHFDTQAELLNYLKEELKQGDVVLVKGSRGLKLDQIVEQLKSCRPK